MSHDESSMADVKILSSVVRIKKEFESEDESEKEKLHKLVNSPVKYESITLKWPEFLYKDTVDYELKNITQEAKSLLQSIKDAALTTTTNDTYTSTAVVAEQINLERKRVYRKTTWPSYVKLFLKPIFSGGKSLSQAKLCYFEVIPEDQPVHCYLDIDADLMGATIAQFQHFIEKLDGIVQTVTKFLSDFIVERFNVNSIYTVGLIAHKIPMANLLAGGGFQAGKYSHHLVLHMDGGETMFKNSFHLNNFLSDFLFALNKVRPDLAEIDLRDYGLIELPNTAALFKRPLFDFSVYRRNGELRLPYACKMDDISRKMMPVNLIGIDQPSFLALYDLSDKLEPGLRPIITSEEAMFYAGLVTHVPKKVTVTHLLSHVRANTKRPNSINPAEFVSEELQNKTISFDASTEDDRAKYFQTIWNQNSVRIRDENEEATGENFSLSKGLNVNDSILSNYEFFELLSREIEQTVPPEFFTGLTLYNVMAPDIVIFANKGTYCEIKKYAHRSNHTFYVCYLTSKKFYQRCFDEECKLKVDLHYNRIFGDATSDKPKYIPRTAKAPFHHFDLAIWKQMDDFLEQNKDRLLVKTTTRDPETGESNKKQPVSGTLSNVIQHNINHMIKGPAAQSKSEISIEEIFSILMEDIKDLAPV